MRSMLIALVVLFGLVLPAGTASADEPDDPTHIEDCRRVLFLHWVDYSRHYVCVDISGFANGEPQYSDVLVVKLGDSGPTGIREAANLDVRIFPNPTADVLTIAGGRFHYELMSVNKQTLREGTIEQTGSIDLHAYPAGVYLLSIEAEDGTRAVKKVIRM